MRERGTRSMKWCRGYLTPRVSAAGAGNGNASPLQKSGRRGELTVGGHVELLFTHDDAPARRYDAYRRRNTPPRRCPATCPVPLLDYDGKHLLPGLAAGGAGPGRRLPAGATWRCCAAPRQSQHDLAKFLKERGLRHHFG
ncbi:MAG: hypothetical protein WKG07_04795 [Hymenobacter sp.]